MHKTDSPDCVRIQLKRPVYVRLISHSYPSGLLIQASSTSAFRLMIRTVVIYSSVLMQAKLGAVLNGTYFIIALPAGMAAIPIIVVLVSPNGVAAAHRAQLIPGLLPGIAAAPMTAVSECRHARHAYQQYSYYQNRNCFFSW